MGPENYLVIRGFCYIRPLYNEVPLYMDKICLNRNEDKITNSEIYKQINNMSLNCVFHYMTKLKSEYTWTICISTPDYQITESEYSWPTLDWEVIYSNLGRKSIETIKTSYIWVIQILEY